MYLFINGHALLVYYNEVITNNTYACACENLPSLILGKLVWF